MLLYLYKGVLTRKYHAQFKSAHIHYANHTQLFNDLFIGNFSYNAYLLKGYLYIIVRNSEYVRILLCDTTGCISLSHNIDQLLFLKEKAGQCNKTNAAIWWLLPHYILYYWNQVLRMRSSVWRPLRPSCAARTKNHAYHKQSSLFLAL